MCVEALKIGLLLCLPLSQGIIPLTPMSVDPNESKLIFYYGPTFKDSTIYNLMDATDILKHPEFIHNETHLYLHGYTESQNSESVQVIVDAYTSRGNINLIVLDWSKAAGGRYITAALVNIQLLAPVLSEVCLKMFAAGLPVESFSVVSHSLGSQLAGLTGQYVIRKSYSQTKLFRITGLDPAYPLFLNSFLRPADAQFVDVIHTDIGFYGQLVPNGNVDFWPNGGRRPQPGCPQISIIPFSDEDLCSHHRSWRFWAESIKNVNGSKFWAFPAGNYVQFVQQGAVNLKHKAIQMGIDCPRTARGNYYLRTRRRPPFAMGFNDV